MARVSLFVSILINGYFIHRFCCMCIIYRQVNLVLMYIHIHMYGFNKALKAFGCVLPSPLCKATVAFVRQINLFIYLFM